MTFKLVTAINQGKILAVDWQDIQDVLGEEPNRKIICSICENSEVFPPVPQETYELSENDVTKVLRQAKVRWIAHDYVSDNSLSRFKTRYFAVSKPKAEGCWLESPNS